MIWIRFKLKRIQNTAVTIIKTIQLISSPFLVLETASNRFNFLRLKQNNDIIIIIWLINNNFSTDFFLLNKIVINSSKDLNLTQLNIIFTKLVCTKKIMLLETIICLKSWIKYNTGTGTGTMLINRC